jgi:hypothetical protein
LSHFHVGWFYGEEKRDEAGVTAGADWFVKDKKLT